MKSVRISLFRLARHDFCRAMRAWRSDIAPKQMIERLIEQQTKALRHFLSAVAISLVITLWISNKQLGSEVSLSIFTLTIELPVVYVSFAASFMAFVAIVNLLSYLHLNEFLRYAVSRHYKFDNPTAMALPFDGSAAWSLITNLQFRFFESHLIHKVFIFITVVTIITPIFLILFYIYVVAISVSLAGLSLTISSPFGIALSVISLILLAYPLVLLVALFVPFNFVKNKQYIRWNFLCSAVHQRAYNLPQIQKWLDK